MLKMSSDDFDFDDNDNDDVLDDSDVSNNDSMSASHEPAQGLEEDDDSRVQEFSGTMGDDTPVIPGSSRRSKDRARNLQSRSIQQGPHTLNEDEPTSVLSWYTYQIRTFLASIADEQSGRPHSSPSSVSTSARTREDGRERIGVKHSEGQEPGESANSSALPAPPAYEYALEEGRLCVSPTTVDGQERRYGSLDTPQMASSRANTHRGSRTINSTRRKLIRRSRTGSARRSESKLVLLLVIVLVVLLMLLITR